MKNHSNASPLSVLQILCQQPGKTGSGVFVQAIVSQAFQKGYRQRVVIGVPADTPCLPIPPLLADSIFPVFFDTAELPFPVAGMSDIMPYVSTRFSTFSFEMLNQYLKAFEKAIQRAVSDFRPDVIHAHHLWLVTALTRRMFPEIPMVTSCHGTEFRQLERAPHLIPHVIPDCSRLDCAMALHPHQVNEIRDIYGIPLERIEMIGGGFREDIFCRSDEDACKTEGMLQVAYVGKISRPKGVPWLIEALSHIDIPEGYRVVVKFVGSSGDADAKNIPRDVDRTDCRLEFLGALPQEDLAKVLRSSQIFVLPSFFEGLPLVVLEALACGCRIVMTDLPGLNSWLSPSLEESGFVERVKLPRLVRVDEPEPADLPEYVKHLSDAISRQLRRSLDGSPDWSACVMPCIQPMGWAAVFQKIEAVYLKVLADRRKAEAMCSPQASRHLLQGA